MFTVTLDDIDQYLDPKDPLKPTSMLPPELKDFADVFSPK